MDFFSKVFNAELFRSPAFIFSVFTLSSSVYVLFKFRNHKKLESSNTSNTTSNNTNNNTKPKALPISTTPEKENEAQFRVQELFIYPVKGCRRIQLEKGVEIEDLGFKFDRNWMIINESNYFQSQRQIPKMALIQPILTDSHLLLTIQVEHPLAELRIPLDPAAFSKTVTATIWGQKVEVTDQGDAAAHWLTQALGVSGLRLVRAVKGQGYQRLLTEYAVVGANDVTSLADGFPFLMANRASLDDLNVKINSKYTGQEVSMNRFRPNIVITPLKGQAAWAEDKWTKVKIGDTIFHVVKPCERCSVTTIDQESSSASDRDEPRTTLREFRRGLKEKDVYFGWNLIQDKLGGKISVGDQVQVLEVRTANHPLIASIERSE